MTDGTLTAADVAAVTRDNDDMFGGGGWWIWIILIAFLFPMFGNGWNNTGVQDNFISDEFVKRDIFNTNQNVSNSACQTQRDVLENRYNLGTLFQTGNNNTQKDVLENRYQAALQAQNLQAQLASCCCDVKETILADGQATRQLMQDNIIQSLRDKLADRDRDLQAAQFQNSQIAQTAQIVGTLLPTPRPAYMVNSPYVSYPFGYGGCASGNVL